MADETEIVTTADERSRKMIEAEATHRTVDENTVRDTIGYRGDAYLEAIEFCGLEEVPVAYQDIYTRRFDYFPDDAAQITDELVRELREEHEREHRPSVLDEDGFIKFQLRRDGVRFTVYEPRRKFDLDALVERCNADDVTGLEERAIPLRRRRDLYRVYTGTDSLGNHLFPGTIGGIMFTGFIPFITKILGFVLGLFAGIVAGNVIGGVAGLVAMIAIVVSMPFIASHGVKMSLFGLALLENRIHNGQWWSTTPYGQNFDGAIDYLRN